MKTIRKIMDFILVIVLITVAIFTVCATVILYPTMEQLDKVILWIIVVMLIIILPTNLFWWIKEKIKKRKGEVNEK